MHYAPTVPDLYFLILLKASIKVGPVPQTESVRRRHSILGSQLLCVGVALKRQLTGVDDA